MLFLILLVFIFCDSKNSEKKEKAKSQNLINLFVVLQRDNIQTDNQCNTQTGSGSKFTSVFIDADVHNVVGKYNDCNADSDCVYEEVLPIIGQMCGYCLGQHSFAINVNNVVQIKKEFEEKNNNSCVSKCQSSLSVGCIASTTPDTIIYTSYQIKCNSKKKCERIGIN